MPHGEVSAHGEAGLGRSKVGCSLMMSRKWTLSRNAYSGLYLPPILPFAQLRFIRVSFLAIRSLRTDERLFLSLFAELMQKAVKSTCLPSLVSNASRVRHYSAFRRTTITLRLRIFPNARWPNGLWNRVYPGWMLQ
jgi:hypothetical protein